MFDFKRANTISVIKADCYQYPKNSISFRPSIKYPEYIWGDNLSSQENKIYDAVRKSFYFLGLDKENFGRETWNPLGKLIGAGDNVLIKPNLVMEKNPSGEGTDCLYTQPAVVAPVIDYILIALKGTGQIVIGDAPLQECDFDKLINESGYRELIEWYRKQGCNIRLEDFRGVTSDLKYGFRIQHTNKNIRGKIINLGTESEFFNEDEAKLNKLRITNYDPAIMKQHHTVDKHEYYISDYVLNADCIINMPKPKSHRKAGVTISLKNLVGINIRKEFLPHHTKGSVEEGGDEYERKNFLKSLRSEIWDIRNKHCAHNRIVTAYFYNSLSKMCNLILRIMKSKYSEGSWFGNHTISRTICDLNKIIYYADKNGTMQTSVQRKMLIVADMIICGEKEGPLAPSSKNVGIIASAINPVFFDETICALMGFDENKIPTLESVKQLKGKYRLFDDSLKPKIVSNLGELNGLNPAELKKEVFNFIPASGWKGKIERNFIDNHM